MMSDKSIQGQSPTPPTVLQQKPLLDHNNNHNINNNFCLEGWRGNGTKVNVWCSYLHVPCVKVAQMLIVLHKYWGSCGSGGWAVAPAIAGLVVEWSRFSVHWKAKCSHVVQLISSTDTRSSSCKSSCHPHLLWCSDQLEPEHGPPQWILLFNVYKKKLDS